MRLKELNVISLIPIDDEINVGDLMTKIQNLISINGIEALSLPQTRRTMDYILECLQEEELVRIFLSRTRPPRKFVILTTKGRKYLNEIFPKEPVLFDTFIAGEKGE